MKNVLFRFWIQHEAEVQRGVCNHAGIRSEHQAQLEDVGIPFAQILKNHSEFAGNGPRGIRSIYDNSGIFTIRRSGDFLLIRLFRIERLAEIENFVIDLNP